MTLQIKVTPSTQATQGYHEIRIRGESGHPEYLRYQSGYHQTIEIERGTIRSANRIQEPSSEVALSNITDSILLDSNEGLELVYMNGTDAEQKQDRIWNFRIRES